MCRIVFLLACLACSSHGQHLQTATRQVRRGQGSARQDALAMLMLALKPSAAAAFHPVGARAALNLPGRPSAAFKRSDTVMSDKKIQVKYFDARGAAEQTRILLSISGADWEDTRYEIVPGQMFSPSFNESKFSGELKANLNRAPVLVTEDGVTIGQSKAMERYVARRFNLMGQNPTEEALIDCVGEHIRDIKDAERRKGFSFFARDKTEEEKAAARSEWFTTDLPGWFAKLEEALQETGSPGFSVGSSLSLADVAIFSMLRDTTANDKEDIAKAAENFTALKAIADTVESHERVAKWLKERPETRF